jgi:hypothetical protein
MLECDFTQFYGADIRDLWNPDSRMTTRWVVSHAVNLPPESRLSKFCNNDPWTYNEHLLASAVDAARQSAYFSSLAAAAQIGKEFSKYAKKGPKPIERPTIKPKPKKEFTPIDVAMGKFLLGFKK